ncbi:nicotinic acid plasma membrane transporter [Schizosaccharomyces cryophilus OY26]|uniref:Nicotinic acid plasma membrane transporter n=1 Tax=Schizosaccharomyces cryophilus (strain OY26 / ATCC MYA-4695 / CBS 11777 / NBRC 106824 / NRRL Y48691) TaxID=653667 RepID=S9X521_SCHCR|nr:nicotinic acid plasma membrane transporter [Schizosaccharomyces cryophilus OY26]EPY52182.1 nicotinic acid plasma membrane transporter [Schizosaccharomyces cryophilus OY26]
MRAASGESEEAPKVFHVIVDEKEGESTKSSSSDLAEKELSVGERRRLLRRLDLVLAPTIMIFYLIAFLDRTNIGNAKIAGLTEDIHLKGNQFNIVTSLFYVTFILFEIPTTLLIKKFQPKQMLTLIVITFSLTTIFTGFVQNYAGFLATRLVLGVCEAGLFPCLTVYLTMIYSRDELAPRIAYLFAASALSGAFSGLFAYAILHMHSVGGYAGWRWLFIIEGMIGFVAGVLGYFVIPNDPAKAWFLSEPYREMVRRRQAQRRFDLEADHFDWKSVKEALKDFKIYLSSLAEFGQDTCLYGFSTFLPAIIRGMGHQSLSVQYLTIPVYILGAAVYIIASFLSDRFRSRGLILITSNIFPIIGYILLLTCQGKNNVLYFACYLCSLGIYTGAGLNVTWLSANVAPHYKRATAISMQMAIANSAGILSGQVYQFPPKYVAGHATSLVAIGIATVLHILTIFYYSAKNTTKRRSMDQLTPDELLKQPHNDDDPQFLYML